MFLNKKLLSLAEQEIEYDINKNRNAIVNLQKKNEDLEHELTHL
jgi:hypothetical protein